MVTLDTLKKKSDLLSVDFQQHPDLGGIIFLSQFPLGTASPESTSVSL